MKYWDISFQYDHKHDSEDIPFEKGIGETPEEVMKQYFNGEWKLVKTAQEENGPVYHFRMKDANVTVYVQETDSIITKLAYP